LKRRPSSKDDWKPTRLRAAAPIIHTSSALPLIVDPLFKFFDPAIEPREFDPNIPEYIIRHSNRFLR
jgi:hypothetical protein